MYIYFKRVSDVCTGNYVYLWKPQGWSDKNITAATRSD